MLPSLLRFPLRVRTLFVAGNRVEMVISKVPITKPLELPVVENVAV